MSLQRGLKGCSAQWQWGRPAHRGHFRGVLGALSSPGGFYKHPGEQGGTTCLILLLLSSRGGQGWLPQAGCAQGDMDCKNLWQEELKAALRHRRAQSERKGAEQLPKP